VWRGGGRKVLFSKEKKQKTLANSGVGAAWERCDSIKKKQTPSAFRHRAKIIVG
jgi:hypothetical protein